MKKARFITFEGGEGAGKTTLISHIEKELTREGIPSLVTREPGGCKLGEKIRDLLLHSPNLISPYAELALFLASRAQHVSEIILPALATGKWVLCDRFNDSSIAYQGAARGLGVQEVANFCQFVSQSLTPDLTFYLDIEPELGLKRAKKRSNQDRIESEALFFHQKIRQAYLDLTHQNPKRIHLLNATLPIEEVYKQAYEKISFLFTS
ncbi:MAG TPA: dTMP kinase [Chlamydiales bacterium]|nr:dTMP kinase [Chlamydiales bacterium]